MDRVNLGVLGAGRIGRLHAENIIRHFPEANLYGVADPFINHSWLEKWDIRNYHPDVTTLLSDSNLDAVLICTPSDTHTNLIEHALKKNLHIFCEKPVSLYIEDNKKIGELLKEYPHLVFQVGFNRRFDPGILELKSKIEAGDIGDIYLVKITSRDPGLPSRNYLEQSGGMFLDMTIHDFDMAQYLTSSKITKVFAKGSALVEPELYEINDIDTAIVQIEFESGVLGVINNSREACYGYDQQVEVFGSKGVLVANNVLEHSLQYRGKEGTTLAKPQNFFLERYQHSYINELRSFIDSIKNNTPSVVGLEEATGAVLIAYKAQESLGSTCAVEI